jgi:hypothetical protein
MITSKTLLITILWLLFQAESPILVSERKICDALKVSQVISEKNGGYTLDLTISDGHEPYKVILSKQSGDLVTEDFDLKHFESLTAGIYTCVVVDKQNCKKKLEITIP